MPRRIQDIIPSERRSIRNIPLEKSAKVVHEEKKTKKETPLKDKVYDVPIHLLDKDTEVITEKKKVHVREKRNTSVRQWKWLLLALGICVVVAGIGFVASNHYSHATFTIIPRVIPVTINSTYITQGTPGDAIVYELMSYKGTATTTISASSGATVSTKAQGKVTLFNSFSPQAQRLIAGTRLTDSTGRIYRLNSSVSVPGYTLKSGSIIPGSIAGMVTADVAGESYNINVTDSLSDFKIIAYKGTSKYESIYGRLASSISGGFVGVKKVVSPTLLASTSAILQTQLTMKLAKQALGAIPTGYIMYPDAYKATFTAPTISGTDPKNATVSVGGTLYVILFKKTNLVSHITGTSTMLSFGSSAYTTPGLESLHFNIINAKDFSPEKKNSLIIHLQGDIKVVGTVPVEELKKKLAGASLSQTEAILKPYSQVIGPGSSGELTPPWTKVPLDTSRINIVVQQ